MGVRGSAAQIACRLGMATAIVVLGSVASQGANETRTLTLHHIHTGQDITITFKRNGQYDETALKRLNTFVARLAQGGRGRHGPAALRHDVGGQGRDRLQGRDPHRLRLSLAGHQLHAAQPQRRCGEDLPAHAGQGDGFLLPWRRCRTGARRSAAHPGRRRGLLPDLRHSLRPHGRRQRAPLASHDARSTREGVPERPHAACADRRQSAAGLRIGDGPITSAASAANSSSRPAQRNFLASLFSAQPEEEETSDATPARSRTAAPAPSRRPGFQVASAETKPAEAPAPTICKRPAAAGASCNPGGSCCDVPGRFG